jgi:type III restriction enzyme
MKPAVNSISNRLSLRPPQRESLGILDRVCEIVSLEKGADPAQALAAIRSEFPTVTDFDREFPSLCFALATGVGKTRLMGAFVAYLHQAEGIRHFFVMAPNLTIYNKLIADFTPNTPKYVFQGIAEFASDPPEIITGDNYEGGRGIRKADLFGEIGVHINIFNISKINSEVRGGKSPRIKRLSEYIGESYFDYLSGLDDLVLLMDESHRYRATAGVRAINELKPILGLELTATPQVEAGNRTTPFNNVIYSYPLSSALNDGFVKEPAVATRQNFNPASYDAQGLETLKLEDGVRIHEHTKVQLEIYARQNERKIVKPFMLVVAQDTVHANALVETISSDSFFEGRYKGRVITVHSNQSGEERDETVGQLLSVEDPNNPTEIVVHVNMLKEGWDVTNLYTIVPLRAANSRTLVEQSIGRGLRLPYGKRTGVADVDRLTIVSHDKFQEIVDEANRPDSIIRTGIVIGRDVPDRRENVVVVESNLVAKVLGGAGGAAGAAGVPEQQSIFQSAREQEAANVTLRVLKEFERLPRSADLQTPEIQQQIVEKVTAELRPAQGELGGLTEQVNVAQVVARTIDLHVEMSIDIPRIIVVPTGEVSAGFRDFDLDCRNIRLQPVARDILIQHLVDQSRHRLVAGDGGLPEQRLEDYLVRGLIDFNDVSYDDHAELLYKLAGQAVAHVRSYLSDEEDVRNVLQYHQKALTGLIHAQMVEHFEETATAYEAHVSRGFTTLKPGTFSIPTGESARPFRATVDDKLLIRGMLFCGFGKCLYPAQKFDSDSERRFAVILEDDPEVLKWFKPSKGDFQIYYRQEEAYEPDFVVETRSRKWICEPKRSSEMTDETVIAKARAAALWCQYASGADGGKPWSYMLVPHDAILANMTLAGFAAAHTFNELPPERAGQGNR